MSWCISGFFELVCLVTEKARLKRKLRLTAVSHRAGTRTHFCRTRDLMAVSVLPVLRRYIQLRLSQRGHRAERGTHTHMKSESRAPRAREGNTKHDTATGESNICARDTVLTLECRLGGCKRWRARRHERPVVWYGTLRFLSLRTLLRHRRERKRHRRYIYTEPILGVMSDMKKR